MKKNNLNLKGFLACKDMNIKSQIIKLQKKCKHKWWCWGSSGTENGWKNGYACDKCGAMKVGIKIQYGIF